MQTENTNYENDQPFWFKQNTIHHQVDDDLKKRIFRVNKKTDDGKYDACWFMDNSFDINREQYHVEWTESEIETLWIRIIEHAMDVMRYAQEDKPEYQEAVEFINSILFEKVCLALELDCAVLREGIEKNMVEKYNKQFIPADCIYPEPDHSVIDTMFIADGSLNDLSDIFNESGF